MLSSLLPKPKYSFAVQDDQDDDDNNNDDVFKPDPSSNNNSSSSASNSSSLTSNSSNSKIPPYPLRTHKNSKFVPTTVEDFEDGGAFPEVSVLQYPLMMGKKGNVVKPSTSGTKVRQRKAKQRKKRTGGNLVIIS